MKELYIFLIYIKKCAKWTLYWTSIKVRASLTYLKLEYSKGTTAHNQI